MAKVDNKIVCDSDVFINLLRNDNKTIVAIENIGNKNIIMPTITAMELCKGTNNKAELKKTQEFINCFSILQMNNKGILLALEFIKKYHLSNNMSLADALIAASVVIAELKLFTFNVKDFDFIKGLILNRIINFT